MLYSTSLFVCPGESHSKSISVDKVLAQVYLKEDERTSAWTKQGLPDAHTWVLAYTCMMSTLNGFAEGAHTVSKVY